MTPLQFHICDTTAAVMRPRTASFTRGALTVLGWALIAVLAGLGGAWIVAHGLRLAVL